MHTRVLAIKPNTPVAALIFWANKNMATVFIYNGLC